MHPAQSLGCRLPASAEQHSEADGPRHVVAVTTRGARAFAGAPEGIVPPSSGDASVGAGQPAGGRARRGVCGAAAATRTAQRGNIGSRAWSAIADTEPCRAGPERGAAIHRRRSRSSLDVRPRDPRHQLTCTPIPFTRSSDGCVPVSRPIWAYAEEALSGTETDFLWFARVSGVGEVATPPVCSTGRPPRLQSSRGRDGGCRRCSHHAVVRRRRRGEDPPCVGGHFS